MARYVIAVGSNLGDRLGHLQAAGTFLRSLHETPESLNQHPPAPVAFSSILETAPVGPSLHPFLNAVATLTSSLPPQQMLARLKAFEQVEGRSPDHERWAPRELDMDIISVDELVIHDHSLIIPHQSVADRLFVLVPLQELLPNWVHPITGQHVDELIRLAPPLQMTTFEGTW